MSILSVRGFSKAFGNNVVLNNINVEIERGEVVAIIGPSGTGKSTFLRGLNMLDPPTSGEVFFDGVKIQKSNMDDIRKKMGMVFQNFGLFSHLTVTENIVVGQKKLLKISDEEAQKKAEELLETVGLTERADHYPSQLSGGQKQRVAIARCLAMSPEVILFDEPTSALDPTMVGEVMAVIRSLAQSGMTMLIVTHEMEFARYVSNRIFYMDEQGIYEDGTPEEIFENPQKPKTREFIFKIRSFDYEIKSRKYDYVEMLNSLDNFCFRHAISQKMSNALRLMTEELVMNIIVPKVGACRYNINYSEELNHYEMLVTYGGEEENLLETAEDELTKTMIEQTAKEVTYSREKEKNHIRILL